MFSRVPPRAPAIHRRPDPGSGLTRPGGAAGPVVAAPPLGDQEVHDPARPDRGPGDRDGQRRRVVAEERGEQQEVGHEPDPVGHDGERQRDAAEHPAAVVAVAVGAGRSVAGEAGDEPQNGKRGVADRRDRAGAADRGDGEDREPSGEHAAEQVGPAGPAVDGGMSAAEPGPDLQARGDQRDRAEQDVGDQQRIVQRQVRTRGNPGRCGVEAQVGGEFEGQERRDDHE